MSTIAGVTVELSDATVRAGGRVLLQDAAATFEPGQVTLIVGVSGAGKTTLAAFAGRFARRADDGVRCPGHSRVRRRGGFAGPATSRRGRGVPEPRLVRRTLAAGQRPPGRAHRRRRPGHAPPADRSRGTAGGTGRARRRPHRVAQRRPAAAAGHRPDAGLRSGRDPVRRTDRRTGCRHGRRRSPR